MHTFSYLKSIFIFSIALFFSTSSWAGYPDFLSGTWSHDGKTTSINRNSLGQYIFCNEDRDCATGFLAHNKIIEVPKWSVTGRFAGEFNSIVWSNGTQWFRYDPYQNIRARVDIQGRWLHNGRPVYIQMERNGRLLITNERAQTNRGYRRGNQLIFPELNLTGYLSYNRKQINWSNNTTWVR